MRANLLQSSDAELTMAHFESEDAPPPKPEIWRMSGSGEPAGGEGRAEAI